MKRLAYVAWIWVMAGLGAVGFALGSVGIVLGSAMLGNLAAFWMITAFVGGLVYAMTFGVFEVEAPKPLPNRDARRQIRRALAAQARERETRRLEIEAGVVDDVDR